MSAATLRWVKWLMANSASASRSGRRSSDRVIGKAAGRVISAPYWNPTGPALSRKKPMAKAEATKVRCSRMYHMILSLSTSWASMKIFSR